jgi:GxxExxY protein
LPLEHEELTGQIIGAAIAVHEALGPGFLEAIYEEALVVELRLRGIAFTRQHSAAVVYREVEVGIHRLDLFVENLIVVELKAIKAIKAIDRVHFAVVRSYLRAVGRKHGLILNFALAKLQPKRVILE